MANPIAAILVFCAMSAVLVSASWGQQLDACAEGTNTIQIEETFVENGGSTVNCRGTTTVRNCDGECRSSSLPSVRTGTGFKKTCKCCKEARLATKEVLLTECYDSLGNPLIGQSYPVLVPEPESCSCITCSL